MKNLSDERGARKNGVPETGGKGREYLNQVVEQLTVRCAISSSSSRDDKKESTQVLTAYRINKLVQGWVQEIVMKNSSGEE